MFIIQRLNEINKHAPASWHLVKSDPKETNNKEVKNVREYQPRYQILHTECYRFKKVIGEKMWVPLALKQRNKMPRGDFGDIIVLHRNKVEEIPAKKPYTQGW